MISELDMVVLTRDLSEHGLQKGDVGTIVHALQCGGGIQGRICHRHFRGCSGHMHVEASGEPEFVRISRMASDYGVSSVIEKSGVLGTSDFSFACGITVRRINSHNNEMCRIKYTSGITVR